VIVAVAVPVAAKGPKLQMTGPLPEQLPWLADPENNAAGGERKRETVVFELDGPALFTVAVNVSKPPMGTGSGLEL